MARLSYPRSAEPRPEALPPAERTVGQVVAEAIRTYGQHFFPSLVLGLPAAAIFGLAEWAPEPERTASVIAVGAGLSSWALERAVRVVYPDASGPSAAALAVGVVAFTPAVLMRVVIFPGIYPLAFLWLAATVFAVPAVLIEGASFRAALARSVRLARAAPLHALGGIVTLVVTIVLTALVLTFLLRGFGDQRLVVAALLALVVVTPLFFLGVAVLYADQAARVRLGRALEAPPAKPATPGDHNASPTATRGD